jgi:ribosome-binding protein aMBF1 (putative translation factor)
MNVAERSALAKTFCKGGVKVADIKHLTEFGREVKKRLIDLDMTQSDLARRIGVSGALISSILHGKRPDTKQKESIRAALGIECPQEPTNKS